MHQPHLALQFFHSKRREDNALGSAADGRRQSGALVSLHTVFLFFQELLDQGLEMRRGNPSPAGLATVPPLGGPEEKAQPQNVLFNTVATCDY